MKINTFKLTMILLLFSGFSFSQDINVDSLLNEQVQIYIENYPSDIDALTAKRLTNIINSHRDRINILSETEFESRKNELLNLSVAIAFYNEKINKGNSLEKAKEIYKRQSSHKIKAEDKANKEVSQPFTVTNK